MSQLGRLPVGSLRPWLWHASVCRTDAGYELHLACFAPTIKVSVLSLRQNQTVKSAALGQFGVKF